VYGLRDGATYAIYFYFLKPPWRPDPAYMRRFFRGVNGYTRKALRPPFVGRAVVRADNRADVYSTHPLLGYRTACPALSMNSK
jgi:hypothetical protein